MSGRTCVPSIGFQGIAPMGAAHMHGCWLGCSASQQSRFGASEVQSYGKRGLAELGLAEQEAVREGQQLCVAQALAVTGVYVALAVV